MRIIAIFAALALAACTNSPPAEPRPLELAGTWRLQTMDGAPPLSITQMTLIVHPNGQIGGSGGCNSIGLVYKRDGDTLEVTGVLATTAFCVTKDLDFEATMDQEHRFLGSLSGPLQASRPQPNQLVLTGAHGPLVFARSR